MAEIRLPGLATGIDTGAIIEQLMAINSRRLQSMQAEVASTQNKKEKISELESMLKEYNTSISNLSNSSQLKSYKAATSDEDIVTAEANSNAYEGNHTIEIRQLATSERWIHDNGFANTTTKVGAGNFIFSYNNQELVVQTTADTTLEDFVGLINNDTDNPGVNASILKYDSGTGNAYHLVLNGKDSGSDYQITINDSNTEVWDSDHSSPLEKNGENAAASDLLQDLDSFSEEGTMGSGSTSDQIHIAGFRHDGSAVDYYFDVDENTTIQDIVDQVNEAYETGGVRTATATYSEGLISLTSNTSGASFLSVTTFSFVPGMGSAASITLPSFSQDVEGGTTSASIASLASGTFNEISDALDSEFRVDGYPAGDWISRSSNTVDDVISGVTFHLHDTNEGNTEDINLTRNTEALKTKVEDLMESYNAVVAFLEENTGFSEDGTDRGVLATDYNIVNVLNQIKLPFQSNVSGFTGDDSFMHPNDIGLTLDADGTLEFDSSEFDDAIVDDYLGVLSLIGALKSGSSSSSDIKFQSANKYTTAGVYEVRVYGDGAAVTSAQIRLQGETDWRDMVVVDGSTIMGNSSFDSRGYSIYDENSLIMSVDATKTSGTPITASIRLKQGFAGAADDNLDTILDPYNGIVPITRDSLTDSIENQNDRIEQEQTRLEKVEQRLIEKYARLESYLQQIQSSLSAAGLL